jgi:hypothetical protein
MTSTTTSTCDCRVTLHEVAGAIGSSPEHVAAGIDYAEIGPDWRGIPSVSVATAAEFVRSHREAERRHLDALDAHAAYLKERAERRAVVMHEAFVAGRAKHRPSFARLGGPFIKDDGGNADQEGRDAAAEAGERFDAKNPALEFAAWVRTKEGRVYAA